jgi:hypothetical protein
MGNCLKWLISIIPFRGAQHHIAGRRLRELRVLAEGGYGYIWRVQDTNSGTYLALKKMICQVKDQTYSEPRNSSQLLERS